MERIGQSGEKTRKHTQFWKILPPVMVIFLSFLAMILFGSILLVLPFATDSGHSLSYIDALFLSVSAVCVTGLTTVADVGGTLSIFGCTVLGILIQIGGLGLVTIVSFVIVASGKRLNMATASVVKESLNQSGFRELRRLLVHIVIITLAFEILGTGLSFIVFSKDYPAAEAFGISLFHAVSSFNNAGYDIIGSTSMSKYADDVLLNLTTCGLVIAGGLGFLVYEDLLFRRRWKKFSIQTRLVLVVNLFVLAIGFLMTKALQGDSITWLQAFFYSVNLRTAGFASFDVGSTLKFSTAVFSMAMMFVGGSPLSTAGGIKTTTLYVLLKNLVCSAKGRKPIIDRREISPETFRRASLLFTISIIDVFLAVLFLSLFEAGNSQVSFLQILFECFSAFGTVGDSMGITTVIGTGSKITLCFLMYFGRLGPVTLLNLWTPILKPNDNDVEYLSTDISIG